MCVTAAEVEVVQEHLGAVEEESSDDERDHFDDLMRCGHDALAVAAQGVQGERFGGHFGSRGR